MVKAPSLRARVWLAAAYGSALLGLAACSPDLEGGASIIDSPRILAVRSEPAEAAPKGNPPTSVKWSALFVGPQGDEDPSLLDWAVCTERKPLVTTGEMSLDCLAPTADVLVPLGSGDEVSGTLPDDACRLFGPNPPLPKPGEPAPRPTDPDATGGFYQPLRVREALPHGDEYSVGLTRISCGLARVSAEQALDYQARYRENENPELTSVELANGSGNVPLTDDPETTAVVKAGSHVTFNATWPECPLFPTCGDGFCGANEDKTNCPDDCTEPHGCAGSEPYVAFDLASRELVDRREAMRVSWYSNHGTFDHDRSGRTEEEAAVANSSNTWTAPGSASDVRVWVVLRDDRGGVAYRSLVVRVE
jgi:hypothetical protein